MPTVKLYGYVASPFVSKTWCYLQYKGVDFTFIPVSPNPHDPNLQLEFTNQTQVPVLQIDGEWRLESSHHAYWLDEVFPEEPSLCPSDHAKKVKELDKWVDDFIIAMFFRPMVDFDENNMSYEYRMISWRSAILANARTPFSSIQDLNDWPKLAVTKMNFVKHMGSQLDLSESTEDTQARFFEELVAHLGEGPFFGELDVPTMLDLSLFPNLVQWYLVGSQPEISAAQHPAVKAWLKRVAEYLPANPTPHYDEMLVNSLAQGLA